MVGRDHKSDKLNAIRGRAVIDQADVVVVRSGDTFRQKNAACDVGYAIALGTPIITLRDPSRTHARKEVAAAAAPGP